MLKNMSKNLRTKLEKVFWITISWILISMWKFLIGYGSLLEFNCDLSGVDTFLYFQSSVLTGLIAGIIGGFGMVFFWEGWLRSRTYGRALFSIFLSYCMFYIIVSVSITLFIYANQSGLGLFERGTWEQTFQYHTDLASVQNFAFWLVVVLITLITLLVNDKYGPGVFREFLMGKYFLPKREERIFMFLDLRSSTSIAEKLGEERYFNFLNDVFKHTTSDILNSSGEIYQYVGDEIVISWKMSKGTENANCLQCFFQIQETLRNKASYFEEKYGTVPEFKAGLHYGHVMAGEVGVVKRDIAFSGDVLNTTSRIQAKCNDLGVNLLLSKFLLDKLALKPDRFNFKKMGDLLLRGKEERVVLFGV